MDPELVIVGEDDVLVKRIVNATGSLRALAATDPSTGSEMTPAAVVIGTRRLDGEWFERVATRLRDRSWWSRTVLITELSAENASVLAQLPPLEVFLLDDLDCCHLPRTLMKLARRTREEEAARRFIELLQLDDDLLVEAVRVLFRSSPPGLSPDCPVPYMLRQP